MQSGRNIFVSNGNLTFNPLLTSNGGSYCCNSSEKAESLSFNITVQSKGNVCIFTCFSRYTLSDTTRKWALWGSGHIIYIVNSVPNKFMTDSPI